MVIIGCMHGALGFNRSKREDAHLECLREACVDAKVTDYYLFERRGSILRANQNAMEEYVRDHNSPGNVLVLFGHSTGAWNLCHVLNRVESSPGLQYRSINAVFTDINHGVAIRNRNTQVISILNPFAVVVNFLQTGSLGGMQVTHQENTNGLLKFNIELEGVTHSTIATHQVVKAHLTERLMKARKTNGNK